MVKLKCITLVLLLVLLLTSLSYGAESQKYALLVGINDYTNFDETGDLSGCVNDVTLMSQLLVNKYGFSPDNVKVLLDKEATAENIEKSFREHLIGQAKPGDIVIFHFSGHGTYLDDDNKDEADGLDEALCAADCDVTGPEIGYIRDDLLGSLIDELETDDVTIVLDCCHSGTGTRNEVNWQERKYVPPFMVGKAQTREVCTEEGQMKGVVITGCTASQVSADAYFDVTGEDGIWMGALSKNIYNTLLKAAPGTTYEDLMDRVRQSLSAQGFDQEPQLEGDYKSRNVFNVPSEEINRGVPITSVAGDVVEISQGCIGGAVTVGSIYEVYPPGTKDFSLECGGKIEITETSVLKSRGKLMEGRAETGGTAIEVAKNYADNIVKLAVLNKDLRNRLEEGLNNLGFVNIVGSGVAFDRVLQINDDGKLALLYPDGRTIIDMDIDTDDALIISQIESYLENAYMIKNLANLENPHPEFNLQVWVNNNSSTNYIGDTVTFNFKADKDCYITLIDVGTDGTVTILYPNYFFTGNKITAGQTYSIPSPDMGFNIRVAGPAGQEMVKAIATLEPVDISNLGNGGSNFKSVNTPVQYIQDIPALLSKGLALETTDDTSENTLQCSGWATASVVLTVTHK